MQYKFKCNGQITGYQVQTQVPITGIEGQPQVTNYLEAAAARKRSRAAARSRGTR